MRKILLFLFALSATFVAAAQDGMSVRGGLNISNITLDGTSNDNHVGFNLGVVYDKEIAPNLYVQPGLLFTTRGTNNILAEFIEDEVYSQTGDVVDVDDKINVGYLQIPVTFSYRFDVGDDMRLALNAGPYFAYALYGKYKVTASAGGHSETEKYNIFKDDEAYFGDLKRLDVGMSLGAGLYFSQYYVGISWDRGLSNVSKDSGSDNKIQNTNVAISLGYSF